MKGPEKSFLVTIKGMVCEAIEVLDEALDRLEGIDPMKASIERRRRETLLEMYRVDRERREEEEEHNLRTRGY